MERLSEKEPGYDCKNAPCQHTERGEHGIFGGAWRFTVKNGPVAIVLRVLVSTDYPETVSPDARDWGWPAQREHVCGEMWLHRTAPTLNNNIGASCTLVDGGRCFSRHLGYLIVDQFAPLLGETFENQPEAMWLRLEEMAAEFRAEIEKHHD